MGFGQAISVCFNKYVTFSGRAARSEYWFWVLFTVLVSLLLELAGTMLGGAVVLLDLAFSLGTLLPSLAVSVRRLHDIDRTGWWLLIGLVPILGWVVLLVFACLPGSIGPNRFGETPLPGQPQFRGMPA